MNYFRPISNEFVDSKAFEAGMQRHSFELEQYKIAASATTQDVALHGKQYLDHVHQQLVAELTAIVAKGSQSQVRMEKREIDFHIAFIPKTAWDWLKKLVIEFEPTLNFGWLQPNLIEKTVPTRQDIIYEFWNVYPLQPEEYSYKGRWPNKIEWLTTTPPTDEQLKDACREASENAMYMARNRFLEQ